MKNNLYIIFLFLACFLVSCNVEDGDSNRYKTTQGYLAYSNVKKYTDDCVFLTEMIARVSLYAQSPDELKEGVRKFYLRDYQITEKGNMWLLEGNDNNWTFIHNNKAINESGALWKVTLRKQNKEQTNILDMIKEDDFILSSHGDKNWQITATNLNAGGIIYFADLSFENLINWFWNYDVDFSHRVDAQMNIKATHLIDNSLLLYDYTIIEGTGKTKSKISLDYTFTAPVSYVEEDPKDQYATHTLTDGEIDMVVHLENGGKDEIKAKVEDRIVSITMQGITDVYNVWW